MMSSHKRRLIILALMAVTGVSSASGQGVDTLHPGLRVRVGQTQIARRLIGTLTAVNGESLVISPDRDAEVVRIPREAITSIEKLAGTHRPLVRGALWGGLAGLAIGTTLVIAVGGECADCNNNGNGKRLAIGLSTLGGSVLGLAVGSATVEERWRTMAIPQP